MLLTVLGLAAVTAVFTVVPVIIVLRLHRKDDR